LGSIVSAALISACSVHGNSGDLPSVNQSNAEPQSSKTFHFTRAVQTFKVPSGVTQLVITAYGAAGGGSKASQYGYPGGEGAKVKATIPVKPGELLKVIVGSKGIVGGRNGGGGGFNGGGGSFFGYGGGGSSDVRIGKGMLADRILVAGGGGGSAESYLEENNNSSYYWCYGGAGGVGGAKTGGGGGQCNDPGYGGVGGSQQSGGAGGRGGSLGSGTLGGSSGCAGANGAA